MSARTSTKRSLRRRGLALGLLVGAVSGVAVGFGACSPSGTSRPTLVNFGGSAVPLSAADVALIIQRAVLSIDAPDMHVAVTSRTGDILGVFSTLGGAPTDADNIAVSLARTTSFFSNSQAPLSSRTVETLGSFHFPPTFASELLASQIPASPGSGAFPTTVLAPTRRATGVAGTPQGPLWQINSTNRGAFVADRDAAFPPSPANGTVPQTFFNRNNPQPGPAGEPGFDPDVANIFFDPSRNVDGTFPSPGITLLPGAVPLFKSNGTRPRLVGGVGVYVVDPVTGLPDVEAAEYAAIQGANGTGNPGDEKFFFDAIPLAGAITIVGVLLPYVKQTTLPAGYFPRGAAPGAFLVAAADGRPDPFGYLIGPRDGVDGFGGELLTTADVQLIIAQVVDSANLTRGQVRLPLGSSARVIATIVDTRGLILAHYRMEDTLTDAIDVVPAKARSTVYYCRPGGPFAGSVVNAGLAFPFGDQWNGFPLGDARGIALTTRTLGFLSQPFFPPGIGGTVDPNQPIATPAPGNTPPGPLYNLALLNQLPQQANRWGNDPDPTGDSALGYRNGLTFFPGSVPLYKNGQLVGALGVSGDGVEQNDLIAFEGGRGFEPPPELRIDNFTFDGVRLPYVKFPETPR